MAMNGFSPIILPIFIQQIEIPLENISFTCVNVSYFDQTDRHLEKEYLDN